MLLVIAHSVMARPSVWLGRICSRLAIILRRWFSCCLLLTDGINGTIYRSAQANKQISGSLWMWGIQCKSRMERRKLLLGFIILAFLLLSIPCLAQKRRVGVWSHFWVRCESTEKVRREHVRSCSRSALQGSSCRQHGWLQWKEEINFL